MKTTHNSYRPKYRVVPVKLEGELVYEVLDSVGDTVGTWDDLEEANEMATEYADSDERDALIDAIDLDVLDLKTLRKIRAMIK
jgi:hypothetical protein